VDCADNVNTPEASGSSAAPQLSPDRAHFWDGSAWRTVAEDQHWFYDGSQWQRLPWWALPDLQLDWKIHGMFLGGHPAYPYAIPRAILRLAVDGVHVNGTKPSLIRAPWGTVDDIIVDGSDTFQRRPSSGALLGFGLLGYAASTGKFAYVTVASREGPIIFEVKGALPREVSAQLQSILQHYPQGAVERPDVAHGDPLEALAKLGQLRDAGIVTADEFEAKKAELLSRM
jgi:Short C-terminal domain